MLWTKDGEVAALPHPPQVAQGLHYITALNPIPINF
jgi:hypothetical protein